MRIRFIAQAAYLLTAIAVSAPNVLAQGATIPTGKPARPEIALEYSYLHSNAPPGGCTCISLNGGSATFAWPLKTSPVALVGDITAVHAGGISSGAYGLTLSTYTAGARYRPGFAFFSLRPFAQALVGLAHSSGTLVQGQTAASNAGAAFAAKLGGGVDLAIGRRFSWRVIDADYLLTTIDNGSNNHQNNLGINTGVVFHF